MEVSTVGIGRGIRLAALATCLAVPAAFGQFTDCVPLSMADIIDANIKVETLLNGTAQLNEPLKLDFAINPDGSADLYWIERAGKLRRLRPKGIPETLGTLPAFTKGELGLLGIALAPGYPADPRVFLYYTPNASTAKLSWFGIGPGGIIPGSEHTLLTIPITSDHWTGGALRFDPQGNLYVSVGSGAGRAQDPVAWHAADTRDLRGKILRIRPGAQGGYTLPEGNLYGPGGIPDPEDKAREEIWAMGLKNPYTLAWDAGRGMLAWADPGPDAGFALPDEYMFAAKPGFFGYPIWVGPQSPLVAGQDTAAPRNANPAVQGFAALPPALGATLAVRQNSPIIGDIYRKPAKGFGVWPEGMDGLWFLTDFNTGQIDTIRIGKDGTHREKGPFLRKRQFYNPLEMRFGPDHALYVIEYGGFLSSSARTSLLRISFDRHCGTGIRPRAERKPAWKRGHRGWDAAGRILKETAGR